MDAYNQNPVGQPPEPQLPVQPPIELNGQPYQPVTPASNSPFEQPPIKKPSKWRFLFIALGILQVLGVAVFILIMAWAYRQADAGVSGTEFIGLALFVTLVPADGIVALINLIGLPIYMIKRKPRGRGLIFSVLSLFVSTLLVLYGAYNIYQLTVVAPRQDKKLSEQIAEDAEREDRKFAADNAKPEITKDEAITLLKTCQLSGFYYTNQTDKENGGWGELSTTGVVLTKINGEPYRISIADRLIPELVPIAREAQKTCDGPQFWHDGRYEQQQADGTWR